LLVNGVSPAANSTLFEDTSIWRGGKTFFGGFLLVVFLAERASASDWTMPFYFPSQAADLATYLRASGASPFLKARRLKLRKATVPGASSGKVHHVHKRYS
jgi:hypothetical protein